jgi:hypothetical protein
MTLDDFRKSLAATDPPTGLTQALTGLWFDAKGDWTRAHESAQQDEGRDGSWVHAHLHRKEGDEGNAAYWYSRAGKPVCRKPLDEEWLRIAKSCWDDRCESSSFCAPESVVRNDTFASAAPSALSESQQSSTSGHRRTGTRQD